MTSRSTGDLRKIYRYSEDISKSRGRILMMLYNEQNRGITVDKRRASRLENQRVRLNKLSLMRHDEIMRVYSNAVLDRNISPLPRRRHRSTRSVKPRQSRKSPRPRPMTAARKKPSTSSSSRSRSVTPTRSLTTSLELVAPTRDQSVSPTPSSKASPSPPPRPVSPIIPMKVTHIVIEPTQTIIDMVPTSMKPNQETDDEEEEDDHDDDEEKDDNIYPEGVIDFSVHTKLSLVIEKQLVNRLIFVSIHSLLVQIRQKHLCLD